MAMVAATLLVLGAQPTVARAWTEARVESASAHVAIDAQGGADVIMVLRLHVRRGWLSALTLDGFDAGMTLSETDPPLLHPLESEGPVYRPSVRASDGGRVRLGFERREAPRRGDYRVSLNYHVALGVDPQSRELRFTLPGFEAGLDGVELVFELPAGTQLSPDSLPEATTQVSEARGSNVTRITLRRAHVPRTVPWVVVFRLAGAAQPTPERAHTDAPQRPLASSSRGAPYAFALLFVLVGWIRRRRFAARADALSLTPSPLIPHLPAWVRDATLLVSALGYARACSSEPLAAIVFLSVGALVQLERVPATLRPARPGAFRPLTDAEGDPPRELKTRALGLLDHALDGTRLSGLLLLGLLTSTVAWLASLEPAASTLAASATFACAFWVPTFFSGHARTLPPSMPQRIRWARAQAAQLTTAETEVAVEVVVHRAMDGRAQDVRLELRPTSPASGLLRLQLLLASSPGLGRVEARAAILVVVRPGSSADRRVSIAHPQLTPWTCSERRAYLIALEGEAAHAITSLGRCLTRDTTPKALTPKHAA